MKADGLWIPPSARESERDERTFGCHLCLRTWPKRQRREWEQHFAQCVSDHRDEIARLSDAQRLGGVLDPMDPEIAEHMRKVGERMIREGRLEVKPNERAGF